MILFVVLKKNKLIATGHKRLYFHANLDGIAVIAAE